MSLGEAILYGAIQGLTEYLPVSSSAHLILLPKFLGTQDPGLAFDVFLHAGTLATTLWFFRREWGELLRAPIRGLAMLLALSTAPALVLGYFLHDWVATALRGNLVLAVALSLGGLALWGSDRGVAPRRAFEGIRPSDALWIGFAQCLALVPGMSRSGSTMMGARLLGFDRATAARYSFLCSTPVTAAALVFELRKFGALAAGPVGHAGLAAAGISSFVFGWFAVAGLLRVLPKIGFGAFAVYRIALAGMIIAALGM